MNKIKLINAFKTTKILSFNSINATKYSSSAKSTGIEDLDLSEVPVTFVDEDDPEKIKEQQIQASRNKSRLLPQHRNMLHNNVPYEQSQSWIHDTVKYKRMLFGKFGLASGVDPAICFPTPKEAMEKAEYERVKFPRTLQEMIKINATEKIAKLDKIKAREDDIAKKLEKLDQWTKDLNARVAKKESDAKAAKDRKDRLVEEVRRQFGFTLDTRDERFKELLAQKEKEDKKQQKEAKRKVKEAKMLEKLQQKTDALEINEEKK